MLHLATHWPQFANAKYWPQAIDYAVWVFNRLPNMETGLTPIEIWSSVCSPTDSELARSHVFGCPVYVLDASLQDGKKIPKWNPRARLGLFLGFFHLHSSQVPLVLNVASGHISPQFHVIFDDKFETVTSLPTGQPLDKQWAHIFRLGRECFLDVDYDIDDRPILPSLSQLIKDYNEAKEAKKNAPTNLIDFDSLPPQPANPPMPNLELSSTTPTPTPTQQYNPPVERIILPKNPVLEGNNNGAVIFQENTASGGVNTPSDNIPQTTTTGRPRRHNVGTYRDGPAIIRRLPIDGESYDFSFSNELVNEWEHPVPVLGFI
jgi:hypothetical protein